MVKPNRFVVFLCICSLLCSLTIPVFAQEKEKVDIIYCPQCGKANAVENNYCFNCGAKLHNNKPTKEETKIPFILPLGNTSVPDTGKTEMGLSDSQIEHESKILFEHGSALYREKDYEGAIEEFNKIIKLYPTSQYYENALVMVIACQERIKYGGVFTTDTMVKNASSKFDSGLKYGCLGVLATAGLIIIIAIAGQ